jgi:hypothetical protein
MSMCLRGGLSLGAEEERLAFGKANWEMLRHKRRESEMIEALRIVPNL